MLRQHALHRALAYLQRNGERVVEIGQSSGSECPNETGERAFRQADECVAVHAAVVSDAFVWPDRHFGRQSVSGSVDRCAYDGRVLRIDQRLSAYDKKHAVALRIAGARPDHAV